MSGTQSEGASNSASPASSVALSNPSSNQGINNNAPKFGTLVPNRIFVGGISSNTTEAELCQLFSKYGNVKATKIIADRAGVSKGYGFVTFESEEEVTYLIKDAHNIVLKERRLNIAPAVKKQPMGRSFDAASPPPTTSNLYFHNGTPYTFHNGMAFFPPTAHQPPIAALQTSDPTIYQSYGPAQNSGPPYGTPLIVPAPPPMFIPQNYSYQPIPMANGATTQLIYSGSSNSSSASPLAGTPDNPQIPTPLPPSFYPQQYPAQEAYFSQPIYISYSYTATTDFEPQDPQALNEIMQQSQPQAQHHQFERPCQFDRPMMATNSAPRWPFNPPVATQQIKRLVSNKRQQNGSIPNSGANNTSAGSVRIVKKPQGPGEGDMGGGGDAPPMIQLALTPPGTPATSSAMVAAEATAKMQSLSVGNDC